MHDRNDVKNSREESIEHHEREALNELASQVAVDNGRLTPE
jgi:hypothetical protein